MSQKRVTGIFSKPEIARNFRKSFCQLLKGTIAFETKEPTGMERMIAKGGLGDRRRLQSAGPGGLKRPAETLKLPSLGSNDAKAPAKMSLKGVHLT